MFTYPLWGSLNIYLALKKKHFPKLWTNLPKNPRRKIHGWKFRVANLFVRSTYCIEASGLSRFSVLFWIRRLRGGSAVFTDDARKRIVRFGRYQKRFRLKLLSVCKNSFRDVTTVTIINTMTSLALSCPQAIDLCIKDDKFFLVTQTEHRYSSNMSDIIFLKISYDWATFTKNLHSPTYQK